MKLKKSITGLILIILYYAIFGAVVLILTMVVMITVGILAGFAVALVLGVILGVVGGELEFREHRNELHKKHTGKKSVEPADEAKKAKIIPFPEKYSDSSSNA